MRNIHCYRISAENGFAGSFRSQNLRGTGTALPQPERIKIRVRKNPDMMQKDLRLCSIGKLLFLNCIQYITEEKTVQENFVKYGSMIVKNTFLR